MVWWVIVSRLQVLVLGSVGQSMGMFPVSIDPTSLEGRMEAIHRMPRAWVLGWGAHGISSLALLWIFVVLGDVLSLRAGRLTVAVGAIAVALEMVGSAMQIALLEIAQPSLYAAVERVAWLLATWGVSSLWAIAVAVAAVSLVDRRVRLFASLLIASLLGTVVAGLAGRTGWGETSMGITLWLWCAFAAVVSRR